MTTAAELDSVVEAILKTNEPPTDSQRREIAARLAELESDFQRIGGQAFSSELLCMDLPPDAYSYGRSVQRYRLALSCLRGLPDEIWARIFEEGLKLSTWWVANHEYLQVLEQVCRSWRAIASTHYPLWSQPPDIDLPNIFDPSPLPSQIRKIEPMLRFYLSRSGATPISIKFKTSKEVWADPEARGLAQSNLLSLLIDQCHCWQTLELCLPVDISIAVLHPIKGNLPLLQSLRLILFNPSASDDSHVSDPQDYQMDYFKSAPRLRDVYLTSGLSKHFGTIRIDLPWSQLETFETTSGAHRLCEDLMAGEPTRLRTLDLHYYGSGPDLTFCPSVTLPNLETLAIKVEQQSLSLLILFEVVTLPALSNLTIDIRANPLARPVCSFCNQLLEFIKRSKCSLQHLSLSFPFDTRQDALEHILALSPELRYLEIPHLESESLRKLVLGPDSAESLKSARHSNILPKLRVLNLCWYGDLDNPETTAPYFPLNTTGVVDAAVLKEVVYSRTVALDTWDGNHRDRFRPLEEVDLRRYDTNELERDWNMATINAGNTSDTSAKQIEENLRQIIYYGWTHPDERDLQEEDRANPDVHKELDRQLHEMESLDLDSFLDTLVLARRNIPYLLEQTRNMGSGLIPGDDIFKIRERAGKLSDKWKPFILRDARKLPYSWRYTGGLAAHLTCRNPGNQAKDDDELWRHIKARHS